MEARLVRLALALVAVTLCGANYRTQNFVVSAGSDQLAKAVGNSAEAFRRDLAIEWLGRALPPWSQPCPIRVDCAPNMGAGGATSFVFDRGEVFNWDMQIQGPPDRLIDSVLPHEVTHTIFATHFRQPLPRWADEGACTTVEHEAERGKQRRMLIDFLQTNRGIAFSKMFAMREYPPDILPLYSQGHSLASFLVDQGGRRKFVRFLGDGLQGRSWSKTIKDHYGYENLGDLQVTWVEWVRQSSPLPVPAALRRAGGEEQLARNEQGSGDNVIYRGQSADPAPAADAGDGPSVYDRRGQGAVAQSNSGDSQQWQPSPQPVAAAPLAPLSTAPAADEPAAIAHAPQAAPATTSPTRSAPPRAPRQVIFEWSRDGAAGAEPPPTDVAVTLPPGEPVQYDARVPGSAPLRR